MKILERVPESDQRLRLCKEYRGISNATEKFSVQSNQRPKDINQPLQHSRSLDLNRCGTEDGGLGHGGGVGKWARAAGGSRQGQAVSEAFVEVEGKVGVHVHDSVLDGILDEWHDDGRILARDVDDTGGGFALVPAESKRLRFWLDVLGKKVERLEGVDGDLVDVGAGVDVDVLLEDGEGELGHGVGQEGGG